MVLTTRVASLGGVPSGTVTFSVGSSTVCKSVTLNAGSATCSTAALSLGANALKAVFSSSSSNFTGSTSPATTLTVNAASTTTTLSSSANPTPLGTAVTLTRR